MSLFRNIFLLAIALGTSLHPMKTDQKHANEAVVATLGNMLPSSSVPISIEIVDWIFQFSLNSAQINQQEWGVEVNYRAPYEKLPLVCKAWRKFVASSSTLLGNILRSEIANHFSTYMMKQNFNGYICKDKPIPKLTKILTQNCTMKLDPLSIVKYQHFLKQDPNLIRQEAGARNTLYPPKKEDRKATILFVAASIGCLQYFQALQKKDPEFFSSLSNELKEKLRIAAQSYVEITKLLDTNSDQFKT